MADSYHQGPAAAVAKYWIKTLYGLLPVRSAGSKVELTVAYQPEPSLTTNIPVSSAARTLKPLPAAGTEETARSFQGAIASWLLFATVALVPLPLGSNDPMAVAFWCIVLGVCLACAPMRSLRPGQLALAGVAALVLLAYAVVLHEQLADHPWFPVAKPDPVWREAELALRTPLAASVSIVRNQPWFELGRPLVCVLAIACGFLVGAKSARARQLMKVIAWSGAVYALYGILGHVFDPGHILWREKEAYLNSLTGTFVNRNTAGAYFGSCAVVWSVLLWERARREMPPGQLNWRAMGLRLASRPPRKIVVAAAMLFLCLTAMFMTGSRGAVVLSLLALILGFAAFFWRHLPRRGGLLITLAIAGAVVVILLEFIGGGVNMRFNLQGLADEGRVEVYRSTLRMIADHPSFGTGQGTFAYAFPAYRSPNMSIWGVWDIAHNSLLEIASDMGIPIAALVSAAWILMFTLLIRGVRVRRRGLIVPTAGLAVATLAVFHSLIDFSLQIPGYAIVALSLIGAGLAQSFPFPRTAEGA